MDRNVGIGCCAPFLEGKTGSPSNNVAWAEAYLRTKWHFNPSSRLATTDVGRKLEGLLCPLVFLLGGVGSPSNTMWLWQRPTFTPSFISIHLIVWPQYTNVTDRIDNSPIARVNRFTNGCPKTGATINQNIQLSSSPLQYAPTIGQIYRQKSDDSAIRYVLPVLCMTSCFPNEPYSAWRWHYRHGRRAEARVGKFPTYLPGGAKLFDYCRIQ